MLYSTIIIGMIIFFSLATQFILVNALKGEDKGVTVALPKAVKKQKKQPKMSQNDKRVMQILENIDNYNGSAIGQVEVKEK